MHNNSNAFLTIVIDAQAPAYDTTTDSKPASDSDKELVDAFKYEIQCSLFLDNQNMVESILEDVVGELLKIIPIPEEAWQQVRTDYLNSYGQDEHAAEEKEQEETTSPFIEEARKIAGDELLEIKE